MPDYSIHPRGRPPRAWNRAERRWHLPMHELLPSLVREHGIVKTAEMLGVKKTTIVNWGKKIGASRITIFVGDDEEILIRKKDFGEEDFRAPLPMME